MDFEIDVSGGDLLSKNYTIVVASKDDIVRGFKFDESLVKIIGSRYGEGKYRYKKSQQGKSFLKIRIYCIIIYYLFKSIKIKNKNINVEICRDFHGHEREITSNLKYFLEKKLGLILNYRYIKLQKGSNADKYAYLMRNDRKNLVKGYVKISLEDIEKFLK